MKKILLSTITCFILSIAFGQSKFNLICRDFTFQQEVSTTGKNLRNIFEIVITRSQFPFKVLERDKMDKVFETLQEEKNLVKDLSNEWKKKLQLANVDYLVVGDLTENIAADNFDLLINFIKITGDNMTQKLPMIVTIKRKQISDNEELKRIFDREIQLFQKSYFISGKGGDELNIIPKFYEELKKRDSTINNLNTSIINLQKQNQIKDDELKKVKNDISDIKDYANIARLDIYGLEFHVGGSLSGGDTKLSVLMKKVLETKGNRAEIIFNDTALYYANQAIEQFPRFPFGYYAKAVILSSKKDYVPAIENAAKAIEIFEITTQIVGCKPDHAEAMGNLKTGLKQFGIIK